MEVLAVRHGVDCSWSNGGTAGERVVAGLRCELEQRVPLRQAPRTARTRLHFLLGRHKRNVHSGGDRTERGSLHRGSRTYVSGRAECGGTDDPRRGSYRHPTGGLVSRHRDTVCPEHEGHLPHHAAGTVCTMSSRGAAGDRGRQRHMVPGEGDREGYDPRGGTVSERTDIEEPCLGGDRYGSGRSSSSSFFIGAGEDGKSREVIVVIGVAISWQ